MKKLIPSLLCLSLILSVIANASAEGPIDGRIYGKINTAIIVEDNGTVDSSRLVNNASRLGFKGKTDLEDGIMAIYQLEYEIAPDESAADNGGSGIFKQRDAYVGLETAIGMVKAGTYDSPFKLAQGKVDLFNDLEGADIKNLMRGENRPNDIVQYSSPKLAGARLNVARTFTEKVEGEDGTSASVTYKIGNVYAAVAADSKVNGFDSTRVAGQYKIGGFTLGALLNQSEPSSGGAGKDAFLVSGAYKVGKTTLKLQVVSSEEKAAANQTDEQLALGADYSLGKMTKVYAYYSNIEDGSSPVNEMTVYGAGMEHKF